MNCPAVSSPVFLLTALLFAVSAGAAEAPHVSLETFQKDYRAAAAKLEAAYAHSRIDGIVTFHYARSRNAGEFLREDQFELLRSADALREVRHTLRSTDERWPIGSITIIGGDPALTFSCYKLATDDDFTFDHFGPAKDPSMNMFNSPAFASYCVDNYKVTDLLKTGDRRLVSAHSSRMDDTDAIELICDLQYRVRNETQTVRQHFFFQPATWALLGCISEHGPLTFVSKRTYDAALDHGIPRIRSMERYEQHADQSGKRTDYSRHDISQVEFVAIPQGEFAPAALAQLGVKDIPDMDSPATTTDTTEAANAEAGATTMRSEAAVTAPRFTALWVWGVLLVAVGALAVFIVENVRRRRGMRG